MIDDEFKNIDPEIREKYKDILYSNRKDCKIEFFWITFKNSIYKILDEENRNYIDHISNILNNLQNDEKYDEIQNFISENLNYVSWYFVKNQDDYYGGHVITNLKRWKKLTNIELPYDNVSYAGLKCMINYKIKYNKSLTKNDKFKLVYKEILEKLSNIAYLYINKKSIDNDLHDLINYSIEHKQENILYYFSQIIDLKFYLKDDVPNKIIKMFDNNTKIRKIINYIEPKI